MPHGIDGRRRIRTAHLERIDYYDEHCRVQGEWHGRGSELLDPQLHTHAVAANLTYDGVEGRWKALQASGLNERRAYLTGVYRNALAQEVRGLGYEIEQRRDSHGRDLGFEIRGGSDELLERYSGLRHLYEIDGDIGSGNLITYRWI